MRRRILTALLAMLIIVSSLPLTALPIFAATKIEKPSDSTILFDGNPHKIIENLTGMVITGGDTQSNEATNPGTYTIKVKPDTDNSYQWNTTFNTKVEVSVKLTILTPVAAPVSRTELATGAEYKIIQDTTNLKITTRNYKEADNVKTAAGSYSLKVKPADGYGWSEGTINNERTITLTIATPIDKPAQLERTEAVVDLGVADDLATFKFLESGENLEYDSGISGWTSCTSTLGKIGFAIANTVSGREVGTNTLTIRPAAGYAWSDTKDRSSVTLTINVVKYVATDVIKIIDYAEAAKGAGFVDDITPYEYDTDGKGTYASLTKNANAIPAEIGIHTITIRPKEYYRWAALAIVPAFDQAPITVTATVSKTKLEQPVSSSSVSYDAKKNYTFVEDPTQFQYKKEDGSFAPLTKAINTVKGSELGLHSLTIKPAYGYEWNTLTKKDAELTINVTVAPFVLNRPAASRTEVYNKALIDTYPIVKDTAHLEYFSQANTKWLDFSGGTLGANMLGNLVKTDALGNHTLLVRPMEGYVWGDTMTADEYEITLVISYASIEKPALYRTEVYDSTPLKTYQIVKNSDHLEAQGDILGVFSEIAMLKNLVDAGAVGSHAITVRPDDEHVWADTGDREPVTVWLKILPLSVNKPEALRQVETKDSGEAVYVVTSTAHLKIEGTNKYTFRDVGKHTVYVTPADGYVWSDDQTTATIPVTLIILPKLLDGEYNGVVYKRANSVEIVDNAIGTKDLILTFRNQFGELTLPASSFRTRILAVGAGGAGNKGSFVVTTGIGGNGGDSGEVVDSGGLLLKAGVYQLEAGLGGTGDGKNSVITYQNSIYMQAKGGKQGSGYGNVLVNEGAGSKGNGEIVISDITGTDVPYGGVGSGGARNTNAIPGENGAGGQGGFSVSLNVLKLLELNNAYRAPAEGGDGLIIVRLTMPYYVNIEEKVAAKAISTETTASYEGETVTLKVTDDFGDYLIPTVVTSSGNTPVALSSSAQDPSTYTFVMPKDDVRVFVKTHKINIPVVANIDQTVVAGKVTLTPTVEGGYKIYEAPEGATVSVTFHTTDGYVFDGVPTSTLTITRLMQDVTFKAAEYEVPTTHKDTGSGSIAGGDNGKAILQITQDIEELTKLIYEYEKAFAAADDSLSSAILGTKEILSTAIAEAKAELQKKLNDLLDAMIKGDETNSSAIADTKAELLKMFNNLISDMANGDEINSSAIADTKAELLKMINNLISDMAKGDEINSAAIADVKADLLKMINGLISDMANGDEINSAAIAKLQKEIDEKISIINALTAANSSAIAALKQDLAEREAALRALEEANSSAIDQNSSAIAALKEEIAIEKAMLMAIDAANSSAIASLKADVERQKSELKNEIDSNALAVSALEAYIEIKKAELEATDAANYRAIEALKQEIAAKEAELRALNAKNSEDISKQKAEIAVKEAALKAWEDATSKAIEQLEKELRADKAELQKLIAENSKDNAAKIAALEKSIADKELALHSEITLRTAELAAEDQRLKDALALLQKQVEDKEKTLKNLIEVNAKAISDLKSSVDAKEAELKSMINGAVASISELKAAYEAFQKTVKEYETAFDTKDAELAELLASTKKALENAIQNLSKKTDASINSLTKRIDELTASLNEQVKNLQKNIDTNKDDIEALKKELASVKEALEAKDKELSEKYDALEKKDKELDSTDAELLEKIAVLEAQNAELKRQMNEADDNLEEKLKNVIIGVSIGGGVLVVALAAAYVLLLKKKH